LWYKISMNYERKERIGNPELFTGREKDISHFLKWINDIKKEKSKSTAILARRKMGKTAVLERLFNITFSQNDGVIPFYYEVKEINMYIVDFCLDFFLTFIYQYIAFKTRKVTYLTLSHGSSLIKAKQVAESEGLGHLLDFIESVEHAINMNEVDFLWGFVREAPKAVAERQNEFIVQMIDEFQFLNSKIYQTRIKSKEALITDMASGYLNAAESKVSPLLVSGSWVGWLMDILTMTLPSRFKFYKLDNLPEQEAFEMIFKYSSFFEVPVTEETVYLIEKISEGSPFYISAIMRSECPDKDLTHLEGVLATLAYETLDDRGEIKFTWMEYLASAFPRINDKNAKNIVLYLCKNRDREVSRKEIMEKLKLDMTDDQLELRLKALVKSDVIKQGISNYRYQGVKDNIFDKVFRGVYQEEINMFEPGIKNFDPKQIIAEYESVLKELKTRNNQLQGQFNYQKGYFAEYVIVDQLRFHGEGKNTHLKEITRNLPADFNFCAYTDVWTYRLALSRSKGLSVDILARAKTPGDYSIIGEIKNRDIKKFAIEEATAFLDKFAAIQEKENLSPALGFVFSRNGFTLEAETILQEKGIAYSSSEQWLDI